MLCYDVICLRIWNVFNFDVIMKTLPQILIMMLFACVSGMFLIFELYVLHGLINVVLCHGIRGYACYYFI